MKREDLNFFLQKAPDGEVYSLCQKIEEVAEVKLIQKPTPQTLLVPVQDPVNNGRFYGGEVLVTSAIVQVNNQRGWAMVMDEDFELSRSVATLDGAFAAGVRKNEIIDLALQGEEILRQEKEIKGEQVEDTRVSFDLMG